MSLYHFNIYNGDSAPDRDGTDLPDLQTALREGISLFGHVLTENARFMRLGQDWRMEIVDDVGLVLFRFDFATAGTAATSAVMD